MALGDLTIKNTTLAVTTSTATAPAIAALPVVTMTPTVAKPTVATTPPATTTAPIQLVKKPVADDMGLKVEKKTSDKNSMDGFFGRYYTRYKKADTKGKEQFATRYLSSLASNPAKQAAEFERLRKAGVSADEIKILASTIDDLNAKNQFKAADAVSNKGNKDQNRAGRQVVANIYQHFDKTQQVPTSKMLVNTKDVNVIKMAASHAAECDKGNQIEIVKTYQSVENKDVNKILIDQYGQYAKENEIGIHTIMSSSKLAETVEYAASKIGNFSKENRAQAYKITQSTGNEKAITNANTSLKEAETKAQAESTTETEKETKSEDKKTSSNEIKDIINSDSLDKKTQIKEAFKNANSAQKANWLETLSPNELANIINIIPLNELSSEVLGKVFKLMDGADSKSQKDFMDRLNSTYLSDVAENQIGLMGTNIQKTYVEQSKRAGKTIDKNMLSLVARQSYNEKFKEQNIG